MKAALSIALAAAFPAAAAEPIAGPWTEAVVSVRDPESSARLFREVGGWRETGRGAVARSELDYWRLPASASAAYLRLCAPEADIGCIRFVRFQKVEQRPIRLATRPWDTGGIFSIMVRSDDVQALYDRAIALGWSAESEPIRFSFGGSDLRNVVLTGPDGVNLAVYERASPPFTAFPLGTISRGFNSMRMVRDQKKAVAFYRDALGFTPVFDADVVDPKPGPNNFSIPQNLVTSIVRRASALQPVPGETGRVEVMQFVGFVGKDVSDRAQPPNLGILSVRYPATSLAAVRRKIGEAGIVPAYQAQGVQVGGLGRVDLLAVRDPDGSITEFYEAAK